MSAGTAAPLDDGQAVILGRLLDAVVPYPEIPGGPTVADTVRYVCGRLVGPDAELRTALTELIGRVGGREAAWVAEVAAAPDDADNTLLEALRGWAWDGFLADPKWGVNRGGLGWVHVGSAGPPRRRERA